MIYSEPLKSYFEQLFLLLLGARPFGLTNTYWKNVKIFYGIVVGKCILGFYT